MEEEIVTNDNKQESLKRNERKRIWNPFLEPDENETRKKTNEKFLRFAQVPTPFYNNYLARNEFAQKSTTTPTNSFQQIGIQKLPYTTNGGSEKMKFFGFTSALKQNCCAVCGSTFRLTTDLVQHMRFHHQPKVKTMDEKSSEINLPTKFRKISPPAIVPDLDAGTKKSRQPFGCQICYEQFDQRHYLMRHMISHEQNN